jgi:hypothetical protein
MARPTAPRSTVPAAAGVAVGLGGLGLIAVGLWARRDVRRTLARERIVSTADARTPNAPVVNAGAARELAEIIRAITLKAAGGHTYAETPEYIDADRAPTSDESRAMRDERTGLPVENPDHDLWIQATTLQTALMQAYMAFRLADLMMALGAAFVAIGGGLAAAGRLRS